MVPTMIFPGNKEDVGLVTTVSPTASFALLGMSLSVTKSGFLPSHSTVPLSPDFLSFTTTLYCGCNKLITLEKFELTFTTVPTIPNELTTPIFGFTFCNEPRWMVKKLACDETELPTT